jgi:hypothetical protein
VALNKFSDIALSLPLKKKHTRETGNTSFTSIFQQPARANYPTDNEVCGDTIMAGLRYRRFRGRWGCRAQIHVPVRIYRDKLLLSPAALKVLLVGESARDSLNKYVSDP